MGDWFEPPKFIPWSVRNPPTERGPLYCTMYVSAGASYVKLPEMQPIRPDNVMAETRDRPEPMGGEQRTCVRVVQSVVWQAVLPIRADGVRSR